MAKRKAADRPRYMPYPAYDDFRCGCKVSWYYYKDEAKAKECSKAAEHNREISLSLGYDFGYCWPGNIEHCKEGKYAGMYEVCIP